MVTPIKITAIETDLDKIETLEGRVCVFVTPDGKLDQLARRANKKSRGALARFIESASFGDMKIGTAKVFPFPADMKADEVVLVKLSKRPTEAEARKAGGACGGYKGKVSILAGGTRHADEIALGFALKSYQFVTHKSDGKANDIVAEMMVDDAAAISPLIADQLSGAEGVFFTRDLVNEPSNILTTTEFAKRLVALEKLGVEVEVLDEAALKKLGMRTLLAVGQGSTSPSKVVVMKWNGGGDEAPFAFVGKGVVFDTGGISIKPSAGMEDMTMDMGGAGVVSGVMRTLALRKAKANVVGVVGLVENMPDGDAMRPGDVVKSMRGVTIEINNTDAEGRLVLADILWYTQETFNPVGMINLATLTGAIIVALGHEMAGVFSNNDDLCKAFMKAADAEGEAAWRMPMSAEYDEQLKSRTADIKNSVGRPAGSITAAQFLQRFVKPETPWIHLDIAGVALLAKDTDLAPKGATGWGVRALDRLIKDGYES